MIQILSLLLSSTMDLPCNLLMRAALGRIQRLSFGMPMKLPYEDLRKDPEIVLAAVIQNEISLRYPLVDLRKYP
jgi:hypothetical protein